jgi:hypothetical protein
VELIDLDNENWFYTLQGKKINISDILEIGNYNLIKFFKFKGGRNGEVVNMMTLLTKKNQDRNRKQNMNKIKKK